MESINIDKQAIVLLTSYFSKPGNGSPPPLTPTEWKNFAGWLKDKRYTPGSLLTDDGMNIISTWNDKKITQDRLISLLKRGAQMSLALEKWSRAGIWILTRSDPEYPQKLKARLGTISPPILFGVGNKELLNGSGIAVVGSRDITPEDINFSKELGRIISINKYSVVSGGAKGVDETVMLGALAKGGYAVGVLADSLLRKSLSQMYREYLMNEKLVLISPYYPEAGFNVGNAMGRNKYIYCISDAAIVVHSGLKGGTWTGANENLNKKWVPIYVKENNSKDSGNSALINNGAKIFNGNEFDLLPVNELFKHKVIPDYQYTITTINEPKSGLNEGEGSLNLNNINTNEVQIFASKSLYDVFIIKLNFILQEKERTSKELKEIFQLTSAQLKEWLSKAEKEKIIKKLSKPVRYRSADKGKDEQDLFN